MDVFGFVATGSRTLLIPPIVVESTNWEYNSRDLANIIDSVRHTSLIYQLLHRFSFTKIDVPNYRHPCVHRRCLRVRPCGPRCHPFICFKDVLRGNIVSILSSSLFFGSFSLFSRRFQHFFSFTNLSSSHFMICTGWSWCDTTSWLFRSLGLIQGHRCRNLCFRKWKFFVL